jgi:hypothetical protein
MNESQAVKVAVECINKVAKPIYTHYRHYEQDPQVWSGCKARHDRYVDMMKAIKILEAMAQQRRLLG